MVKIDYILFKQKYSFYPYISFENNVNLCLKSRLTKKLAKKCEELDLILIIKLILYLEILQVNL